MLDVKKIVNDITQVLLHDCMLNITREREREVRAVFVATVGLAVVFPSSQETINNLFYFVQKYPMFASEIIVLESRLTDAQRFELTMWKLANLSTKFVINKGSESGNPTLFN